MHNRLNAATAVASLLLSVASVAAAEPGSRVPLVSDAEAAPSVAKFFDGMRASGSQPLAMHRAVANDPALFTAYVGLARAIRSDDHVPRSLRELAILRTLQIENGEYEMAQHTRMARSCGVSAEQVKALATWRESALFSLEQRAVLEWTEGVASAEGPSDAAHAALARFFDPQAVVGLTLTAGFYAMSARTTKALGIRPEPGGAAASSYGAC